MKTKPKYWWILEVVRLIDYQGENSSQLFSIFSDRKNLISKFGKHIYTADKNIKDELIFWQNKGGYRVKVHYCLSIKGWKIKSTNKKLENLLHAKAARIVDLMANEHTYQEEFEISSAVGKRKREK